MQQHNSTETSEILALQAAFQSIAKSVATSIVDALVQPLQQEIESKVNAIIAEATKDIHSKIAAAVGHIQPIQIPISLLAQPVVQPLGVPVQPDPGVVAVPTPTPCPPAQPMPVAAKLPTTASYAEPEPEPFRAAVTGAKLSNNTEPTLKRDKERTPKKSSKNFAATIVGLLPGQAHMIKNDFKYAKLSFVRADARNSSQLVALSKSHNPVIFMTDFVRHASVESVRSAHGNWVYVSGGMNTLREKLQELYQQHQKQNGVFA
jgi:hypothetical protein